MNDRQEGGEGENGWLLQWMDGGGGGSVRFTFFPEVVYRSAFMIGFDVVCFVAAVRNHSSFL